MIICDLEGEFEMDVGLIEGRVTLRDCNVKVVYRLTNKGSSLKRVFKGRK